MDASETMFVDLIRCALNGETPTYINGANWDEVLKLASSSETLFALYTAINRMPDNCRPCDDHMQRLLRASDAEIYCETVQSYAYNEVLDALGRAGVRCCPVKGFVMRNYYPVAVMRAMCDCDIFIQPSDKELAREVMISLGYRFDSDNGVHMVFDKPPMLMVELHEKPLFEYSGKNEAMWDLWENLYYVNEHSYYIPPWLHYIYLLLHLDKHMRESGFGIRVLMDMHVLRKSEGDFLQDVVVKERLVKYNLYGLARSIRLLEGAWFDGEKLPREMLEVESWVLHGGVYGVEEQQVIRFLQNESHTDTCTPETIGLKYILGRIFLSPSQLKYVYPELNEHPGLYYICLIKRWKKLLKKRMFIKKRINMLSGITPELVHKQDEILHELYKADK